MYSNSCLIKLYHKALCNDVREIFDATITVQYKNLERKFWRNSSHQKVVNNIFAKIARPPKMIIMRQPLSVKWNHRVLPVVCG